MTDPKAAIGSLGEEVAARFIARHGLSITDRNLKVGKGEVDILARDGATTVVIEVRTVTGESDPLLAFDRAKARQVRSLAGALGAARVDLVAVRLAHFGVEIRWVPDAA